MLTLTPGVDFDLDLVNARIQDGTYLIILLGLLVQVLLLISGMINNVLLLL